MTFPFVDGDFSPYATLVSGANPANVVDIYTNPGCEGFPAVMANEKLKKAAQEQAKR